MFTFHHYGCPNCGLALHPCAEEKLLYRCGHGHEWSAFRLEQTRGHADLWIHIHKFSSEYTILHS